LNEAGAEVRAADPVVVLRWCVRRWRAHRCRRLRAARSLQRKCASSPGTSGLDTRSRPLSVSLNLVHGTL